MFVGLIYNGYKWKMMVEGSKAMMNELFLVHSKLDRFRNAFRIFCPSRPTAGGVWIMEVRRTTHKEAKWLNGMRD